MSCDTPQNLRRDMLPEDWRPRVYLSGPITQGSRNHNFYQAVEAERELMLRGFAPLNPMRSMLVPHAWQPDFPHSLWIECDLPWVEVSDAILRLEGYSVGADAECTHARDLGIPVFYSLGALEGWKARRLLEAAMPQEVGA